MKFTRMDSAGVRPNASRTATPNVPIHSQDLAFDRWSEGERFAGAEIPLAALGGATQVGVNLVELVPGKQSCPLHWHVREEEHFYVLEGRCVLRTQDSESGDERHELGPGDYVCFPANGRVAHAFENPFRERCRLLAIGSRDPAEIAVYPESKKLKLRALDAIVPMPEESIDYWTGERADDPLPSELERREAEARAAAQDREARDRAVEDELTAMKKRLGLP
jgi:uncharacterized cupin superfamily protein